jgi:hypothetical protein
MERHSKIHKQRQDVRLVFSAQSVTFSSPDANQCTAVVTVGTNLHRGGYQTSRRTYLAMLELHCPNLKAIHVMVWHLAVVIISTALGFTVGRVADFFRRRGAV